MSLINEALKRAKEAQAKAPPPESSIPHLRPVESAPTGLRGTGLALPIFLTVVALGGLFFLWRAAPGNIQAKAANLTPPALGSGTNNLAKPVGTRSTASLSAAEEPGRGGTRPSQEGLSAPLPATNAPVVAAVAPTNSALAAAGSSSTNLASQAAPPPPKPALPRLQAIVFNPTRPSAMINGKTLFVGDRLGEFRVLAIDQQSATLVGATRTNVLTLAGDN